MYKIYAGDVSPEHLATIASDLEEAARYANRFSFQPQYKDTNIRVRKTGETDEFGNPKVCYTYRNGLLHREPIDEAQ